MWLSLLGAVLCVAVMFLISWTTALLTFASAIALYLIVSYGEPDVNWGSTTQAQTYKNALLSVLQLNNVDEHVKNYRPQILVLSGLPSARPILIDFADLVTKKLSLLICGHVIEGSSTQRERIFLQRQARDWFKKHKIKGFYSVVDGENFEIGSRALIQASGVGKLKPNIVLMGYKADWQTCTKDELQSYFDTIHKVRSELHETTRIPTSVQTSANIFNFQTFRESEETSAESWNRGGGGVLNGLKRNYLLKSLHRHSICIWLWPSCAWKRVWTIREFLAKIRTNKWLPKNRVSFNLLTVPPTCWLALKHTAATSHSAAMDHEVNWSKRTTVLNCYTINANEWSGLASNRNMHLLIYSLVPIFAWLLDTFNNVTHKYISLHPHCDD